MWPSSGPSTGAGAALRCAARGRAGPCPRKRGGSGEGAGRWRAVPGAPCRKEEGGGTRQLRHRIRLGVCLPAARLGARLLYMAADQMLRRNLPLPGTRPPRPLPSSAAPPAPSPALRSPRGRIIEPLPVRPGWVGEVLPGAAPRACVRRNGRGPAALGAVPRHSRSRSGGGGAAPGPAQG